MTRLHFTSIRGKAIGIIDVILHSEEVASADDMLRSIHLVVEEIVVNIVNYSHSDYLDVEIMRDEDSVTMCFRDGGVPFNLLEAKTPDISLPMRQRKIGGLGIFMVKKEVDTIDYEYTNGENVITVTLRSKPEI